MNTTMNNMPVAVSSNPVTAKMIAERLGLSESAVHHCLSINVGKIPQKTIDLVRKTAEEMGYDSKKAMAKGNKMRWERTADERSAKAEAKAKAKAERKEQRAAAKAKKEADYLLTHNFPSKEAETKRMEYLRAQGYSNMEIAQKVGRCYVTVYRRIGVQAEDMSIANRIQGQKNRAARNAQRRQYVADHTVRTYNGLVTELGDVKTKVAKLETEVQQLKPAALQAAKISQIKMIEDISQAPSTSLQ